MHVCLCSMLLNKTENMGGKVEKLAVLVFEKYHNKWLGCDCETISKSTAVLASFFAFLLLLACV